MATCCKTVVVLSDDFNQELWPQVSTVVLFSLGRSELLGGRIRDDVIVIVCDPLCAIPPELFHFARVYLDDSGHCWQPFFDLLTASGTCKSALILRPFCFVFLFFFLLRSAFLYVCMCARFHISKTTLSNFSRFSVHVTCGRGSVLRPYVLPVLWMTSCFQIVVQIQIQAGGCDVAD